MDGHEQDPTPETGPSPVPPVPAAAGTDRRRPGVTPVGPVIARGVLAAAVVVAVVVAAAGLAVVAGTFALLGWGLAVVVALVLVAVLIARRGKATTAWVILPLVALGVPAVAVAASGVRVMPQRGPVVVRPSTTQSIPADGFRAGFGELLVDLRALRVPDGQTAVVRAGSDLRRTVVALPRHQCFHLDVTWSTGNLRLPGVSEQPRVLGLDWAGTTINRWANRSRTDGAPGLSSGRIALFGRVRGETAGRWVAPTPRAGAPTLKLDLRSEGGSFVVRDYPDEIGPLGDTGWPRSVTPPASPGELRTAWARPGGPQPVNAAPPADPAVRPRRSRSAVRTTPTTTSAGRATRWSAVPRPTPVAEPSPARGASAAARSRQRRQATLRRQERSLARLLERTQLPRMSDRWKAFDREHRRFARKWTALMNGACNPDGRVQ